MIQNNKIMKVVKDQFFMLALVAMVIGFSAFKFTELKPQDSVTLYFQGDPTDPDEVKNPANWTEDDNNLTCTGSLLACSMEVHPDDATDDEEGERELNPSTITLDAFQTSAGYIPAKAPESDSEHEIDISNRN